MAKWAALLLPLPSARVKPDVTAAWLPLVEAVLAEDGLTLATMKIPGMDRPYFSKGERAGSPRRRGTGLPGLQIREDVQPRAGRFGVLVECLEPVPQNLLDFRRDRVALARVGAGRDGLWLAHENRLRL